jgi:hypothetical protein
MSTYTLANAVAEIPAAFIVVPAAPAAVLKATVHRDHVSGTGMTDVVFGQTRRPRGIPL